MGGLFSGAGAFAPSGGGGMGPNAAAGGYGYGYDPSTDPTNIGSDIQTNPLNTAPAAMGSSPVDPGSPTDTSGQQGGGQQPIAPSTVESSIGSLGNLLSQIQPAQQDQGQAATQQAPGWFTATPPGQAQRPQVSAATAQDWLSPQAPQAAPATAPAAQAAPAPAAPAAPPAAQDPNMAAAAAPAAAAAATPTTGAGAGAGAPAAAAPAAATPETQTPSAATDPNQGQRRPPNILQALSDLLLHGPGKFYQDLQSLSHQAGPAYANRPPSGQPVPGYQGPQDITKAATTAGTQQPQTASVDPSQRPADTGGPTTEPAAAPGTAPAQNWWGTRPPDYFQRHGMRPGADLQTVNTPYGRITANRQVGNDLVGLTNDLQAAGVPGIQKFGGYNDRGKRYGSGKSSHAYGAAFDINDQAGRMNPQTQNWINQHPQQWQEILRKHNFAQYMPQSDPNHLEWVGPGAGGRGTAIASRTPVSGLGPGGPVSAGPTTRGDRNKNPGNIKMGQDARQYGATGMDDQGHAIFPTVEAGIQAQASLLRRNYNNKTVTEMGRSYATDRGWARGVMRAGGFGPHERLNLNDPATMDRLQRAIWAQEGTHPPQQTPEQAASENRAGANPWLPGAPVVNAWNRSSDEALRTIQQARNLPADRPRP